MKDTDSSQIREEMERFGLSNGNNAGCAILSDVGEFDNIHPGDKRTVGTRLAALALNRIYGRKDLKCDAPVFASAKLRAWLHQERGEPSPRTFPQRCRAVSAVDC